MGWFWSQPLRRQLVAAIVLMLVPTLAAGVWSGFATLHEREADLRALTRATALTTAAHIDSDLAGLDAAGTDVATRPAIRRLDPAAAQLVLQRLLERQRTLEEARLVSAAGALVARAGSDIAPVDWTESAVGRMDAGVRQTTTIQIDHGSALVGFGYPVIADDGTPAGVLWLVANLQGIRHALLTLPLPSGSVANIVDARDRILIRSLEPERYVGQVLRLGMPSTIGPLQAQDFVGMDGVRRVYADAAVARGPWRVSIGVPHAVAVESVSTLWRRNVTILVFGLIGWVGLAAYLSGRLASSVGYLQLAAGRIADGDFSPLERRQMPSRELTALQDAFDGMLARFNDTRAELDRHLHAERQTRQELQSLQGQVIRQERLAAVGQLVSGVAHEINNPLQAILGFAELLQMQPETPDSVRSDLRLIQKESARACAIIRNLAMFARQQPGEAAPVLLSDVVGAVVELRQRRLRTENIDLCVEDTAQQYVLAVLPELQQVLLNFVVNAEQAIVMSGRRPGRITIRTSDTPTHVRLEVEDTGPGIPPEHQARLFQPFFTTKPVGQGTGLGLSVSYGIIDSLGGRIGYQTAPAGGAILFFELPVTAAES